MVALPPEVWAMILAPMNRRDVINITTVSRTLCNAARRILAQEVTLSGTRGYDVELFLNHLQNHDLLRLTKKLKLIMVPWEVVPWAQLSLLSSLAIKFVCPGTSDYPADFATNLASTLKYCTKLDELVVQSAIPMPSVSLAIPNITKLEWDEGGELTQSFFSLCQASVETIMSLKVVVTDDPTDRETYDRLWGLRFPNLRSLDIGPGSDNFRLDDLATLEEAFTRFLFAHPAIERLTLRHKYDFESGDVGDIFLPLHAYTLGRVGDTILPKLSFLHAHPEQVQAFFEADAGFLPTLHTLSISEQSYYAIEDSLTDLFIACADYNERNGSPSGIRHLILYLYTVEDYKCALDYSDFERLMSDASQVLPYIEVWEGTTPDISIMEDVFPKFRALKKLRCLTVYRAANRDDVEKLSEECLSLETYECCNSGKLFSIARGDDDGIDVQVTQLEVTGVVHKAAH